MADTKKVKHQQEKDNPFEEMIKRLDVAAKIMKLDDDVYEIMKKPSRIVYSSLPIKMDNGKLRFLKAPCSS